MNIIFLSMELPFPDNSGGKKYTWQRLKQLKKSNNDIYLYCFREDNEIIEFDKLKNICKEVNTYQINKMFLNILRNIRLPYHVSIFKSNEMYNDIKNRIEKNQIDCIIIDIPQLLPNCPLNNEIPKILTQHNIEYNLFKTIAENNRGIKKIAWYISYLMMKQFENSFYKKNLIDGYTFISENDMNYFKNKYPIYKSICIPQAVDKVIIYEDKIKDSNKHKTIVFTGKMNYLPNIQGVEWFVKAIFPIIKKEIKYVKFLIVGKDPTDQIKALADEDIIVTGKVDSVDEYIRMSDLVVLPLKSGGGVKIKLFEALQNNKLVISTSKGIEGTRFKHKQHLIVSDQEIEFAEFCIDMLNNFDRYSLLRENALDLIEKEYSSEKIGYKYNKFIKDICHDNKLENKTND